MNLFLKIKLSNIYYQNCMCVHVCIYDDNSCKTQDIRKAINNDTIQSMFQLIALLFSI